MRFIVRFLFVLMVLTPATGAGQQNVVLQKYALPFSSSETEERIGVMTARDFDSLLRIHPVMKGKIVSMLSAERPFENQAMDFYLLLFLFLIPGAVRIFYPSFFRELWNVFRGKTAERIAQDRLRSAFLPSLVMNLFFALVITVYLFYLIPTFLPRSAERLPSLQLFVLLFFGTLAIYAGKYVILVFCGWAFRLQETARIYLFHIFLVKKLLALALLPFLILLAFGLPANDKLVILLSWFVVALFFIRRYVSSWRVFGFFFQHSKFHFFMYLCASELLPLAVLIKLLVRGLLP